MTPSTVYLPMNDRVAPLKPKLTSSIAPVSGNFIAPSLLRRRDHRAGFPSGPQIRLCHQSPSGIRFTAEFMRDAVAQVVGRGRMICRQWRENAV